MVKSIFKRIIVAVSVALILMLLKGSLITNVSAKEIYSWATQNNANFASCASCGTLTYDYPIFTNTELQGKYGVLRFNIGFYDNTTQNPNWSMVLSNARVVSGGVNYVCNIQGTSNPKTQYSGTSSSSNGSLLTAQYSITCPMKMGSSGGITSVYIQGLGGTSGLSIYSPMSFETEDDEENVINAINSNTQAVEETNDTLKDNNVSSETDSTINSVFEFGTQEETFGPVADLVMLPLTLIRAFYNGVNTSCSSYSLGTLFGHELQLPCINLQNLLGGQLYSFLDVAMSIFMILNIILMCIDMFDRLTSFEDPFNELYTPKHTYQPKHGGGK